MWCSSCGEEFENMTVCPKCGEKAVTEAEVTWGRSEYGALLKKWPKTEDGEPERPVFLTHCDAVNMEDRMLTAMLDAYGIPCLSRCSNDGEFGKVILGMPGSGVDLYVPESMADDARALIMGEDEDVEL